MINIPKGTKDVLPKESYKWDIVRKTASRVASRYNVKEIITPTFEHTELFVRGVGEGSDIVNKEMYTFLDKGERSITLKPEGTSPVARAVIENSLYNEPLPLKLYYVTSCFRYERPQAGRLREHHQFGVEMYGADSVESDVEAISIAISFYKEFGIEPTVNINTLGCSECRAKYIAKLREYYAPHLSDMCDDCKVRYEKNPLRILDCKVDTCKAITVSAPTLRETLCDDCKNRFEKVCLGLDKLGIKYKINDRLVRGIDYYTNLVFEFLDEDKVLGQNALGAGGRYNNLVEELGGKSTPVVGFGIGIERLLGYLENKGIELKDENRLQVFVASMTEDKDYIVSTVKSLRDSGISTDFDMLGRSLKSQFKYANKLNAKYVITIGDEEIALGKLTIKDMDTSEESKIDLKSIIEKIKG